MKGQDRSDNLPASNRLRQQSFSHRERMTRTRSDISSLAVGSGRVVCAIEELDELGVGDLLLIEFDAACLCMISRT